MKDRQSKSNYNQDEESVRVKKDLTNMCAFVKADGTHCNTWRLSGKKYCYFHSEDKQVQQMRALASARGGKISRKMNLYLKPKKIKGVKDISFVITEAINFLRSGELPPPYANSIFQGCQTLLKLAEHSDHEKRIEALEKEREDGKVLDEPLYSRRLHGVEGGEE